jgi:MFS family permease
MAGSSVPGNHVHRLPRLVAAAVWVLALGVPVGLATLALATPPPPQDAWAIPLYSLIVATWGLAGAFLVTRRPDNRVGWVLLTAGLGMGLALLGQLWALLGVLVYGGSLPGTVAGATLGLLFNPALAIALLVPLLFPDGRPMSRRWGFVSAMVLFGAGATLAGSVARPGTLEGMPPFVNPLGVPSLAGLSQALINIGSNITLLCLPAGILASVLRYRRGTPVEREQLKWFGSVLALAFSMFFTASLLPQPFGQWAWIVASLSLGLIPVAIGIAILRYRLYEIDRIVSRTLSYALVTALLAAVFVGTNIALQTAVVNATGGSTFIVAGSTLVVAALFQPVRRRIQAPIDRRFNRTRSDAERVVAAFTVQTRDEVDLATLRGSVLAAAAEAVHPAGAGLWLRRTA